MVSKTHNQLLRTCFLCVLSIFAFSAFASDEHTPFGTTLIDESIKLERKAYTAFYDSNKRIARFVAYHITPEYRQTPKRKSRFKKFRADVDIENLVVHSDYTHSGFARGHLAPYFIAGGDRDNDGQVASLKGESDLDDEKTVFEINYMSNIVPQNHKCFNGGGGVWYALESFIRKKLVEKEQGQVWVYAGAIVDTDDEYIGKNKDISVPDRFFKVILQKQEDNTITALAFLFPHYREVGGACNDRDRSFYDSSHLTTVDEIEALTDIRFFNLMEDELENEVEAKPSNVTWGQYYQGKL